MPAARGSTKRSCAIAPSSTPVETVAVDVARLRAARAIPSRVLVSGHVYDVTTGLVETVIPARAREINPPEHRNHPEEAKAP